MSLCNHALQFWRQLVKGFGVAMGQILGLSVVIIITTLAVPCEHVIIEWQTWFFTVELHE